MVSMAPAFPRDHGKLDFLIERQIITYCKPDKHSKSLFICIKREKTSFSAVFISGYSLPELKEKINCIFYFFILVPLLPSA
jgi:hypothetical protein